MKRIVSGITATGNLHIGNYIGAIQYLLKEQDKNNELFVFVADLHGLTIPIDPKLINQNTKEIIKLYLACGLDPKKVKLFVQSEIKEHTELFYLLSTLTNIGQLERMTQYKDKMIKQKNKTNVIPTGILIYPILMVADILLYNPDSVIVGQDQKQHIELTKLLAQKLNNNYDLKFKIPEAQIVKKEGGSKIMALRNPEGKMSKSDNEKNNTIFLLDSLEDINKKITTALTDSENKIKYDPIKKPGISNLITIYSAFSNLSIKEIEDKFKDSNYKNFKEEISNVIINRLKIIQSNFSKLTDKDIKEALKLNRDEIKKIAANSVNKVKKNMGLLNYVN
ncbi:MAG: tryptophan--tRNA ligase [Candidatus Hepatoplasma vulgare]|nr:MAG: tryptophan--tRNA ligase [Candidatus Hepatoplasma sp.]